MRKKVKTFILSIILLVTVSVPASAYVTINNNTLNGGVGNYGYSTRSYYITSSASAYTSQIQSAMSDWIYTTSRLGITTPISYSRTYTQSASVMDVYAGSWGYYPYDGANGWTEFGKYGAAMDPAVQNWGWNKIYLNTYNISGYSFTTQKGVVAHEMGHCFGLNENNSNRYSVMCQMKFGRAVTACASDDANGINYLY